MYRTYLLIVLLVLLAFNNADGLALGLVLQDIKSDLHLSDTQLGFLSGIAFALFYAVMGIPIARWADRGNRVAIIALTGALWAVMVALCGFTTSFAQLLLVRVGVAAGEAGCIPPAYSLIADYFNRLERPRAVAIYLLGGNLSFVIGYFLAGWLNELYGWRGMFILLGLPGFVPALLTWLTLREPRRARRAAADAPIPAASETAPTWREVGLTVLRNVTFRHLLLSFCVASFFSSGILQWLPAFFIRSFGLKTGHLGMWFGLIWGAGGLVGTYWGGAMASRYAPSNERLQLKAMSVAYASFAALSALIYLSPTPALAFTWMGLAVLGVATTNGPVLATIQTLVPSRMRATCIAIIYLFSNLIGMGLGPLAVGALSDMLHPLFGGESLRYALLALSPGYLWGAWHLWRASKTVTRDVEAAQGEVEPQSTQASAAQRTLGKGNTTVTVV